jgi:hypothetical protein
MSLSATNTTETIFHSILESCRVVIDFKRKHRVAMRYLDLTRPTIGSIDVITLLQLLSKKVGIDHDRFDLNDLSDIIKFLSDVEQSDIFKLYDL